MSEETKVSGKLYKATRTCLHNSIEGLHFTILSLMSEEETKETKTEEKPKSVFDTLAPVVRPR